MDTTGGQGWLAICALQVPRTFEGRIDDGDGMLSPSTPCALASLVGPRSCALVPSSVLQRPCKMLIDQGRTWKWTQTPFTTAVTHRAQDGQLTFASCWLGPSKQTAASAKGPPTVETTYCHHYVRTYEYVRTVHKENFRSEKIGARSSQYRHCSVPSLDASSPAGMSPAVARVTLMAQEFSVWPRSSRGFSALSY